MTNATAWVQMHGGQPVDLLAMTREQVVVADLVRSICRLPRYNGHTIGRIAWTVGEHSMLVADLLTSWGCPPPVVREGLLHDLPEGVYGDMPTPVRIALEELGGGDAWRELRRRVDTVVRGELGLALEEHHLVKRADRVALALERQDLMAECERDWHLAEYAPSWPQLHASYDVNEVDAAFMRRLESLTEAAR